MRAAAADGVDVSRVRCESERDRTPRRRDLRERETAGVVAEGDESRARRRDEHTAVRRERKT